MIKIVAALLSIFIAAASPFALAKEKAPNVLEEYLEGAGAGNNGSANVKITVVAKKADKVTDSELGAAAIHAMLFKGYTDSSTCGFGTSTNHAALAGSPTAEMEHGDYFKHFFESGSHMGYVQLVENTRRVVKYGKQYKVSCQLTVNTAQLRRDLEKQGVIRGLNSGW